MDEQLRRTQTLKQSQGAGMLSGLVNAYTNMGRTAQGLVSPESIPMGVYEQQASQQEKAQTEIGSALKGAKTSADYFKAANSLDNSTNPLARAKASTLREKAFELERQEKMMDMQNRQIDMQEQKFAQDTVIFSQRVTQNQMAIDSAKKSLKESENQQLVIDNLLNTMDGLSDVQREFIGSLKPADALKELSSLENSKKDKQLLAVATDYVNNTYFKDLTPEKILNSTAMNNRYLGAIKYYKKVGLDEQAEQLENERKAVVEQKLTIEDREQDVREKWNTNKSVQTQKSKVSASNQGLALLRQGGGLSELAAQVQFFKTIDPESVVKESEIEMANNASGLIQSIEASIDKTTGQGILSDSLRNQLEQFFITAGSVAVEAYNNKLEKEKLAYQGRGLDVEFMFGDEVSLSKPIQDRPEDYTFNLNNIGQPVNNKILSALSGRYSELGADVKQYLEKSYEQYKNDPEAINQLQQQAKEKYGFDALGYILKTQGQ
jgi:hypothetical protein